MLSFIFKKLIRFYQIFISPWLGHNCRYLPTCSQYSLEAIEKFGPIKGLWLTIFRLLRCQPFGGSGVDEVPKNFQWNCWCSSCTKKTGEKHLFTQIKQE